jgi:hypothetical protein
LNVIERRQWVRTYLRYFLRLGEDDRRSVLENSPLSRHLATRKEELLKIGVVPSSVKVSKVGLRKLPLLRLDPLWPEFPPFMLEVLEEVDFPAELPKCVATRNEQRPEAPAQNSRNQTVRFQELDGPVLSGPTAIRGTTRLR